MNIGASDRSPKLQPLPLPSMNGMKQNTRPPFTLANVCKLLSNLFRSRCAFIIALLLVPQAGLAQEAKTYRYWKTNWSFDDIDVGNVLRRLRQIGVTVPIRADGDVSLNFSVSVPVNALRTGRAYKFSGTFSSSRLQLEQLLLTDLATKLDYQDGRLSFDQMSMRWIDRSGGSNADAGTLTGDGSFQLIPQGDFAANLQAKSLSISPAFDLFLKATDDRDTKLLAGNLDGEVAASGPLSNFGDLSSWTVNANLNGQNLSFADSPPLTVSTGPVTLQQSKLTANDIRLGSPVDDSVRLAVSLNTTLKNAFPFEFELRGNDVPLANLASIASMQTDAPVDGKLDIDLRGTGELSTELQDPKWNINGRLASPSLQVFGLQLGTVEHSIEFDDKHLRLESLRETATERILLKSLVAQYQLTPQRLKLASLRGQVFGGTIDGNATFAREEAGTHQVDLQWKDITPQLDTAAFLPASTRLSLQTSGKIDWNAPAESVGQLSTHNGSASVSVDSISLNNSTIGNLTANIQIDEGGLTLNGSGSLFGGTFEVDTVTPLAMTTEQDSLISRTAANIRVNQVNIAPIQRIIAPRQSTAVGQISGTLSIDSFQPINLQGQIVGNNLRYGGQALSNRLMANLTLNDGQLRLSSLRGNYAGGRFEAVGGLSLAELQGRFNVRLEAVDFERAVLPISPELSSYLGGTASTRVTVDITNDIDIRGSAKVRENKVFTVGTGATHANLRASLSKSFDKWSLDLRNIQGTLGRGQIDGNLSLASSRVRRSGFDMESQWSAKRIDFTSLLADFGSSNRFARGELDGTLVLNGTGIQSIADLQGRFDARLGGTQARAVPGLLSTQSYLGAFSLAGTTFDAGRVRGNIGSGIVDLTEFWLVSDQVNVWADGRVRLPSGRLDITAVVQTGDFEAQNLALISLAELAALPAGVPVGAIISLNRAISNRTLYFDVVGQLPRPRVRLRPFHVFRENAAQFILRETAASVIPFSAPSTIIPTDRND